MLSDNPISPKHYRSKFLFRRVEARLACRYLFELDALHVISDAEELKSALSEKNDLDEERLYVRLSRRAEKKRKRGKRLPTRQRQVLVPIAGRWENKDIFSEGLRLGTDLTRILAEKITFLTR